MRTLIPFLKPYKGLILLILVITIVDVGGTLYIPTLVADMINIGVYSGNLALVLQKGALMFAVALVAAAAALLACYFCVRLSALLGRDLRNALYDHSLTFSTSDFERIGTGSMITRTLSDVSVVQQAFIWSLQMILPVPAMCALGVIMSFAINRTMGLVMIGVTVIVLGGAIIITHKASFIYEKMQGFLDRINLVLRENVTGIRVIRAFNKEQYEEKRLRKTFEDYALSAIKANSLFFGLESLAIFVMNACIVSILWLGSNQVGLGRMAIGDIAAVTEYALLILFYIIMAQMVVIVLPRSRVCLRRIHEVLQQAPEISDAVTTVPVLAGTETVCRFDNVSFCFPDAEAATLSDLTFALRRGTTTAIIGSTGSGKSTIAKLILRFHDVTGGAIAVDGVDVRRLSQEKLRQHIAYVPQKAWLFSGTIAANLRYGNEDATPADLWHALDVAQAGFVRDLPGGLDAPVAQGGTNFSGGQKQRLAIARALLKKADLYIFDDSFSALDFKTDAALRHALAKEVAGSAVLIIAQRVSTIAQAEQILVLDDGKMAGLGRHEDLVASCPVYSHIVSSQTKGGGLHG